MESQDTVQAISPEEADARFEQIVNLPENQVDTTDAEKTEREYNEYLNDRLLNIGYMLDAARPHITSQSAAQEWFDLKQAVAAVLTMTDMPQKAIDATTLQNIVHEFAHKQGTTQVEYEKVIQDGQQAVT